MNSLKQKVLEHLKGLDSLPKRSLGQNFLINPMVVESILRPVDHGDFDAVIEIGPGLGALTENLLQTYADKLLVIEMDRKFSEMWRNRGLNVIEADALKINWNEIVPEGKICLVSNLPYQISASIVIERSFAPQNIEQMVLMFQREVAERITSDPGGKDYGILTVVAQTFWKIKKVCNAGKNDFYPAPNVLSRVLRFKRREGVAMPAESFNSFMAFVKRSFQQRRKFLLKNIAIDIKSDESREKVVDLLKSWGFDEKVRAERLSPENFVNLFKQVNE